MGDCVGVWARAKRAEAGGSPTNEWSGGWDRKSKSWVVVWEGWGRDGERYRRCPSEREGRVRERESFLMGVS